MPPSTIQVRSPGSCSRTSEPVGKAGLLERVSTVRPRHLAAEAGGGKELSRIREPLRIKSVTQAQHRGDVVLAEHERHCACLVVSDAVLARDRAARVDAGDEN